MVEKLYQFTKGNEKLIEKIVTEEKVNINHVILLKNDALPEHYSNGNVYLIVLKGKISVRFNQQEEQTHNASNIINVPFHTKMNVSNQHDEILEFFIVKAPMGDQ